MATTRSSTTSRPSDNELISLKLIVEEQKRDSDYLLHIFDRLRAAESVLLAATFATLAYLYYSAPGEGKVNFFDRLFVPGEDYGKVIYFMAAGFFLYGLFKLMLNVFGKNPWSTAYEPEKTDYGKTPLETVQYIKARYDTCTEFNGGHYNRRRNELTFLFFCILTSAIILVVVKTLN